MDNNMTDDAIIKEFDDLFGGSEPVPDPEQDPPDDDDSLVDEDESEDESEDDESEDDESEDDESSKSATKSKSRESKQNYAFAQMRTQLKAQENLLKNLGKAIGMDGSSSTEEIAAKVNEILVKKQSQDTGIPEDVLVRLQQLEAQVAFSEASDKKNTIEKELAGLADKYNLDEDGVHNFAQQLIVAGRNPFEVDGVDLETEFLKFNYQSLMQNAIDKAIAEERGRSKKAKSKSGSSVSGNPSQGSDEKISSVSALNAYFDSLDL